MTQRARDQLLAKLRQLSPDEGEQIAILDQSILHSWASVYPRKDGGQAPARGAGAAADPAFDLTEIRQLMAADSGQTEGGDMG